MTISTSVKMGIKRRHFLYIHEFVLSMTLFAGVFSDVKQERLNIAYRDSSSYVIPDWHKTGFGLL